MLLQGGSFLTLMSKVATFPPSGWISPLWPAFRIFRCFFCSVLLEASPPTALECNRGGESHCCRFWAACQFSFACRSSYLLFNYHVLFSILLWLSAFSLAFNCHVLVSILPYFSLLLCLSVFSLTLQFSCLSVFSLAFQFSCLSVFFLVFQCSCACQCYPLQVSILLWLSVFTCACRHIMNTVGFKYA